MHFIEIRIINIIMRTYMLILQVLQICTSSMRTSLSWGGRGGGGGDAVDISTPSIHYNILAFTWENIT